jgi:hypothetical protein
MKLKSFYLPLCVIAVMLCGCHRVRAQVPVNLGPEPKATFFNGSSPCAGCSVYTYQAGTTTPLATYTDSTGATPNANPVVLDVNGQANIWYQNSAYKVTLKDANGVTLTTTDNFKTVFVSPVITGPASISTSGSSQTTLALTNTGSSATGLTITSSGTNTASVNVQNSSVGSVPAFKVQSTGLTGSTLAVYGYDASTSGTAAEFQSVGTSGSTIGLLVTDTSAAGIAGEFDCFIAGCISLLTHDHTGAVKFQVSEIGAVTAASVSAPTFTLGSVVTSGSAIANQALIASSASTAGWADVAPIKAKVALASQTTALGPLTEVTPSADSLWTVTGSVACHSVSATANVTLTIAYTDISNTAQTVSSSAATCTTLGSSSVASLNLVIQAKSGTAIQYSTGITNSPTYDVRLTIKQETVN